MSRARTLRAAALSLAAAALVFGCEAISGLDEDRRLDPSGATSSDSSSSNGAGGAGGQGSTTGAVTSGGGDGPCVSATYPDPPVDSAGGGALDFVMALRSVDLGEKGGNVALGLDLDSKCTCLGDGPSCLSPSFATADHCDGPGGRDNATAQAFAYLSSLIGASTFSSEEFSKNANDGGWSIIFRVRNYNGTDNDDQIEVDLYPTLGFSSNDPLPAWDGNDAWPVPETSIEPGGTTVNEPRFYDKKGYVSNGILVASLPASGLVLGSDSTRLTLGLTAGFVLGKLVPSAGTFELREAVLAARWELTEVFRTLSEFRDASAMPLCKGDFLYTTLKDKLCSFTDIYSGLPAPTDECDSISLGIGFEAFPAKLGPVTPVPNPSPGCDPDKDPLNDTCG